MSKVKYFIINGDKVLGRFWETEKLGNVFIMESQIDLNNTLKIYMRDNDFGVTEIVDIDILNDFMEILQYNLKKEGLE